MTSKVKGTEGVEFPDATVQGSAAYTKAEANAAFAPKAYQPGEVLQKRVFNGGTVTNLSVTTPQNIIDALKSITPKSANSTIFVEAWAAIGGSAPAAGVNLSRVMQIYETNVGDTVGTSATLAAVSAAGTGISPGGSAACAAIRSNAALTLRSFGVQGYVIGVGSANYTGIIMSITEIQN